MKITDLIDLKEKKGLEDKLKNNYDTDFNQKNPLTPIILQGKTYQIETKQYESLMNIRSETGTKLWEIKEYSEPSNKNDYFGIKIQNQDIIQLLIYRYELSTIPKGVEQLKKLQTLDLRDNQITLSVKDIERITYIKYLCLNNNKISALPKEIGLLNELHCVNLEDNQLSALPAEIMQLKNLSRIYLSNNKISPRNKIIRELKKNRTKVYL